MLKNFSPKLTNEVTYNGEFMADPKNKGWSSNTAFACDTSESFDSSTVPSTDPESGFRISLSGQLLTADDQEWQVFRKGRWVDTVFFGSNSTNADVAAELIEVDDYPADILVLKMKRVQ